MNPLSITGLFKSFEHGQTKNVVLREVSLTAKNGEFIAVMGPSGSGKSTLLHLIAGLIAPDSGQILVNGLDISKMNDRELTEMRRTQVGVVFQSFNLIPSLNVHDNIVLPILAGHRKVDEARLSDLVKRLDIADKLTRFPGNLSGGEQQRAAIARALLPEPAIILADEPTGSLDTTAGQHLCRSLRSVCDDYGRTILMVTHEPGVAAWADRTLVLTDGQIAAELPGSGHENAPKLAASYQQILESRLKGL